MGDHKCECNQEPKKIAPEFKTSNANHVLSYLTLHRFDLFNSKFNTLNHIPTDPRLLSPIPPAAFPLTFIHLPHALQFLLLVLEAFPFLDARVAHLLLAVGVQTFVLRDRVGYASLAVTA